MSTNEKIDAFIASREDWQREKLNSIRTWIHELDVEIGENIRWNSPHFDHNGIMMGMMAFKNHLNIFFHKGALMKDVHGFFEKTDENKGSRSVKLRESDELNKEAFKDLLLEAIRVNAEGKTIKDAKPRGKAAIPPDDLIEGLKNCQVAAETWQSLPPFKKKEYILWIQGAMQLTTRKRH